MIRVIGADAYMGRLPTRVYVVLTTTNDGEVEEARIVADHTTAMRVAAQFNTPSARSLGCSARVVMYELKASR